MPAEKDLDAKLESKTWVRMKARQGSWSGADID